MATVTLTSGNPVTVRCKAKNGVTAVVVSNSQGSSGNVQVYLPAVDGPTAPTNAIIGDDIGGYPSNYRLVRPGSQVSFQGAIGSFDTVILISDGSAVVDCFDIITNRL